MALSAGNIEKKFEEINEVINKALCKYKNVIVTGDSNRDINNSDSDKDKM